MLLALFVALSISLSSVSAAEAPKYVHQARAEISGTEKALTFGAVYVAQWSSYLLMQHSAITEKGSFENWRKYPFDPHFDRDGIGYNLIQHSIAGNYYYLFYRSRGYTRKTAVFWAVASSTAFEFTIETITERPSFQDLYQTPILGSLLGMGMESASLFFHSQGTWPYRVLGYLFNPFTLFPKSSYGFRAAPLIGKAGKGAAVTWEF
jgi:hypothetical protein